MANSSNNNIPEMNLYDDSLTNFTSLLSHSDASQPIPTASQPIPSQFFTPQQLLTQLSMAQQFGTFINQIPVNPNMFASQPIIPPAEAIQETASDGASIDKGKGKSKRAYNKRKPTAGQSNDSIDTSNDSGKTWRAHDYKVLANAWVKASEVPSGRSNGRFFYARVNEYYNQDPECQKKRSFESTKTAWYNLNGMCTKYKGIMMQRGDRLRSGQTVRDLKDDYDKIYRDTYNSDFKAHEAFEILSLRPRWANLSEQGDAADVEAEDSNLRNVASKFSMDSSPANSHDSPISNNMEDSTSNPLTPTSGMLYGGVTDRPEGIKSSKRSLLRNKEASELVAASDKLTSLLSDISIASASKKEERLRLKEQKLRILEAQVQQDADRTKALRERTEMKKARERRLREKEEEEYLAKDVSHLTGEFLEYVLAKKRSILRAQRQRYQDGEESSGM